MLVPPSMPLAQGQGPGPYSGIELERLKGWLESPQKLLRLPPRAPAPPPGPLHRDAVETRLQEEDVITLVRLLAHVALVSRQVKSDAEAVVLTDFFRQRLQNLPVDLVVTLERLLGQLAGGGPAEMPLPVELSEQLSVRLAAETYQRGEVSPSGVHALLNRLSGELGTLRRTLGVPAADDYGDRLEAEFWTALPEPERRRVLTSAGAWGGPPPPLRGGPRPTGGDRRATPHAGSQLTRESRLEMQSLFSPAFARLSQKAAGRRGFRALRQALELLDTIERAQPPRGQELRGQVGVENHLRQVVREAGGGPG